jgi:hypothetical protein
VHSIIFALMASDVSNRCRSVTPCSWQGVTSGILSGMPEPVTTIKVPKSLRERIASLAGRQQKTAAEVITELLDDAERRARFDAVRAAYLEVDVSYLDETEAWDALADDGLRS